MERRRHGLTIEGKLVLFNLPSEDSSKEIELFKYTGKYTFRRMRKEEDVPGEELRF